MVVLAWDEVGERTYETGVDKGVLYTPDGTGAYVTGVAWNGLVSVTETPGGAEATPTYADNIKYLNLVSAEIFGATVEAYTYPPEFDQHDGRTTPNVRVWWLGSRLGSSSAFRTVPVTATTSRAMTSRYKIHLVYGCLATPSEKAYNTVNDSPEAITFSWEISTTPVPVTGARPTSLIVIDSSLVNPTDLTAFETILYGAMAVAPALPAPDVVIARVRSLIDDGGSENAQTNYRPRRILRRRD